MRMHCRRCEVFGTFWIQKGRSVFQLCVFCLFAYWLLICFVLSNQKVAKNSQIQQRHISDVTADLVKVVIRLLFPLPFEDFYICIPVSLGHAYFRWGILYINIHLWCCLLAAFQRFLLKTHIRVAWKCIVSCLIIWSKQQSFRYRLSCGQFLRNAEEFNIFNHSGSSACVYLGAIWRF